VWWRELTAPIVHQNRRKGVRVLVVSSSHTSGSARAVL
jgi:hypothetical protein